MSSQTEIRPFQINVPQAKLDDLHQRLEKTAWPQVMSPDDEMYGPKLSYIQGLVNNLLTQYDWHKIEARINDFPQFITTIDGQNIHFIHMKSSRANATPLMLIHGWPGSFVEFLDVIEPLANPTQEDDPAFDVVVPSIPGFGFSGPTNEPGWHNPRIGTAFIELMNRLGYQKFAVQGGDVGAIIAPEMARIAPEKVIGVHVNAATLGFIPFGPLPEDDLASLTPAEQTRLARLQEFIQTRFGFNMVQANQPQLLAYALADSPVGLMAWMSQLFDATGAEEQFLTNFMIYWVTETAPSSMRLYFENAHDPEGWSPKANSGVPTAVAVFQDDDVAIRKVGEQANTIVRWTEYEKGGHYAVIKAADIWLNDVRESFAGILAT